MMNTFSFYNPVKLHFGKDTLQQLRQEVPNYGRKVLIVYGGGSIKQNGLYNQVMSILEDLHVEIHELSGVEPNPRVETARKGISICREQNIEFILAIGGGSVIDCTKLIATGAKSEADAWDIVTKKVIVDGALPFGTVLTIAATGSEMNSGSVITNEVTKEKYGWGSPYVFPKFSILDPTHTFSVPKNHTVYGIVDMMSHILEQYFNNATYTPVTDELAEGLLRAVIEVAPKLIQDLENYEWRETILLSGTLALNGLLSMGSRGDFASHNIEHAVSAIYDIPHAGGLAILMPHWMRHNVYVNPVRFAQLATKVFGVNPTNKTVEDVAYEGVDRLSAFWTSLGAPNRLADYDIDDSKFEQIIQHTMFNGPFGNFVKLHEEDVRAILQAAL